jgi:hypothetical protein
MFLAITIGTSATLWPAHRDGLPVIRVTVFLVALGIIGLLGAKLYAIGERGWLLLSLDWELRHNYRYPGGILAAAIGAARSLWRIYGLSFVLLVSSFENSPPCALRAPMGSAPQAKLAGPPYFPFSSLGASKAHDNFVWDSLSHQG